MHRNRELSKGGQLKKIKIHTKMKKSIERLKENVDHPPRKQTRRADVGSNSEKTVSSGPNIQRTGSPERKVRKSRGRNCH